jgi:signal transduction histidine kinase
VGVLAEAINDMAVRIERQMTDQRELLAAVSHEIRSPLARLRVLAELLRGGNVSEETLAKLESETLEIDALVDKLLASSRLDFGALSPRNVSARELALRAVERAGLAPELVVDETGAATLDADATLLERALGNLLENAERHGGGVAALRVTCDAARVRFEVTDRGPGFSEQALAHAFDAFYRGERPGAASVAEADRRGAHGSLGLGLSLVERIARAHGGRAWVRNREGGGAAVVVEVARDAARAGTR